MALRAISSGTAGGPHTARASLTRPCKGHPPSLVVPLVRRITGHLQRTVSSSSARRASVHQTAQTCKAPHAIPQQTSHTSHFTGATTDCSRTDGSSKRRIVLTDCSCSGLTFPGRHEHRPSIHLHTDPRSHTQARLDRAFYPPSTYRRTRLRSTSSTSP